jgi:hypothetical protein
LAEFMKILTTFKRHKDTVDEMALA